MNVKRLGDVFRRKPAAPRAPSEIRYYQEFTEAAAGELKPLEAAIEKQFNAIAEVAEAGAARVERIRKYALSIPPDATAERAVEALAEVRRLAAPLRQIAARLQPVITDLLRELRER